MFRWEMYSSRIINAWGRSLTAWTI
ncbi:hypothetical protein CBM2586_A110080 [Cupriavidus phytorum]|uniref:Uncharacterized protein n=1 Tax=Cupriavidus taiwanensis TaxID=164546 RepID=A0A375C089_9BURK|nr:hypothetical protein CBM2586_A110080 [Cupriavidus taiwanensis]